MMTSMAEAMTVTTAVIFVAPYATIVVKAHIGHPHLKLKHPNLNRWSAFFIFLCGKLGLCAHIDGMVVAHPTD
jgi:hypothetical protein